ncbi:hypothetical protein VTN31DRAFT_4868 [Thermomyces dupontii]|uniref:uncharacterized protein n=1 Tax=Talaromyces thermophilus TaxID=28565 RepID=UPI003742592A
MMTAGLSTRSPPTPGELCPPKRRLPVQSQLVAQSRIPIDPAIAAGETLPEVAPAHRRSESKERPAKRPRIAAEQQERCSSCQEHFSRSRFPEQLAFLAWLFYWALERSVPGSPVAFTETHDAQSEERPAERPRLGAEQQERCGSLQEHFFRSRLSEQLSFLG